MPSDCYGHNGGDLHLSQGILLGWNNNSSQPATPSKSNSSSQQNSFRLHDPSLSSLVMSKHFKGQLQQLIEVESNQVFLRSGEKVAGSSQYQATSSIHEPSPGSSPSLDGQSLYCTEVLPSTPPPSQPIPVEEGRVNQQGVAAVSKGADSQPVQYTIFITNPQLQQSNSHTTTSSTNSLVNTLLWQQEQQKLQQHITSAFKANSSNGNLTAKEPETNANVLLNNFNINGSNKLSNLLINNNNNNNLTSNSQHISATSTFPSNLIVNGLSNGFDGKNIQLANLTFAANNNLPVILNSGLVNGGIVILNYSDLPLQAASNNITNVNQLAATHRKVQDYSNVEAATNSAHKPHNEIKEDSEAPVIDVQGGTARNIKTTLCSSSSSNYSQGDLETHARNSELSNRHVVIDKHIVEIVNSSENNITRGSQSLASSEQQLSESASVRDSVSVGMHSGRTGPGSGQAHNTHPQQQYSPISSASTVPTAAVNKSAMLSAGQPALPSDIFRTGGDNTPPRFTASGSYVHAQYPSIYGIHNQSTGHLTLQPYSPFFPGFGGTSSSGHTICHGPLMPGVGQGHYPQVESYSAMLASMGSHVLHRCPPQATDRPPRMQVSEVAISQHVSPFLTSTAHMAAPGVQYPGIQPTSHRRLSDSPASSPGKATPVHSPTSSGIHQDSLSSHHLEKMASMKGASSLHSRDGEVTREMLYGNPLSHEEKSALSPRSYPKVSFDTVVKEYGGSRDCSSGRGDVYVRSSLSGKEGSLKHRILTRPSDSDMPDDYSQVSGMHGLKDEPLTKRLKLAGQGPSSLTFGAQTSPAHHSEHHRSSEHQRSSSLAEALSAHHHPVSKSNITKDTKATASSHHVDDSISEYLVQSPHQQPHTEDSTTDSRYKQHQYHSSPSATPPSTSPSSEDHPSHLQYPSHFFKGSIIQLANGSLKRVEDLRTEDFVNSAEISSDLKVDSSTVVKIEENPDGGTAMLSFSVGEHRVQVTVEATLEHPFFVFGQGWSSCSVSRTLARYGLDCQKLNVGDVCISLTHKDVSFKAAEISQQQQQQGSVTDPHRHIPETSSTQTIERQSFPSQGTSTMPASTSGIFSSSSSGLKLQHTSTNILPPPSTISTPSSRQRLSQTELPPPLSNIVLVKKESNNNTRKRDSQRFESEVKEEALFEEASELDTGSLSHERRWLALDQSPVKTERDKEKVKYIEAKEVQKSEKTLTSTDNGRQ